MRALVVYESMFGNTRKIAETVAVGIGEHMPVHLVEVAHAPVTLDPDIQLLVVGGPTHARGMTTAQTRSDAADRAEGPMVSRGIGMRDWLLALRPAAKSTMAAAFDTRIHAPMVFTGSAARGYLELLDAAGFRLIEPTESFYVGSRAPQEDALNPGEVDRAGKWGRKVAAHVPVATDPHDGVGETSRDRDIAELRRDHDIWAPLPDSGELEHDIGRRRI